MRASSLVAAIIVATVSFTADAQWLNLPTPGLPRLPNGEPDLTAPAPRTADGKPDFSGLWRNHNSGRYYNNIAADLAVSDVAPAAQALFEQRHLEYGKDSMETQCMPIGPAYLTIPFREFRIVQTPALIAFLYNDGMHREIFMDGRALEPEPNPTWMGYSVGRWEGDTLVVESNGYTDRSWLDFGGHPHTEALRITERYTRDAIGKFELQITLVDPTIFFEPIDITVQAALQPDTEMLEYICENHEESRARMSLTQAAEIAEVPAETLAGYVGIYDIQGQSGENIVEVTIDAATLYIDFGGAGREPLVPLSPARFSWSGTSVVFVPSAGGGMNVEIDYAEGQDRGARRK
jgi:hypothetical protein